MKKVAVILSGCGFLDGSEIYETVLTLLALDNAGVDYQCFAPDIPQKKVVNYTTKEEMTETRNVLIESARLARGDIQDIKQAKADDFDALILPGGFGAAINLSDFAEQGANCTINSEVQAFASQMHQAKKPLGFICIAPALIPKICGAGIRCTIGNDPATAKVLETMGAIHEDCTVDNIVIDSTHKIVSTPAYMLGPSISHVAKGITKLVDAILAF